MKKGSFSFKIESMREKLPAACRILLNKRLPLMNKVFIPDRYNAGEMLFAHCKAKKMLKTFTFLCLNEITFMKTMTRIEKA